MTLLARSSLIAASPHLVAAIGCSSTASADEIVELVQRCLAEVGAAPNQLVALASHRRKSDHPGLNGAARQFALPLCLLGNDQLDRSGATPSTRVFEAVGVPAVAEAVAAAAGPLLLSRRQSAHATCALASVDPGFDPLLFGQPSSASAAIAASSVSTSTAGP